MKILYRILLHILLLLISLAIMCSGSVLLFEHAPPLAGVWLLIIFIYGILYSEISCGIVNSIIDLKGKEKEQ